MTASILFYAAFADLRDFKIRNELVIIVGLLFFVYAGLAGQWTRIPWNIGLASLVLAVLLLFYSWGHVGGGDVKMLTVAFLWTGIDCAFAFSLLLLVFATLHVGAAKFGFANIERLEGEGSMRIPFAPSIAAALMGVFVLGCVIG